MKTLFLTVALLVAGIICSTAQTNPTSTNGVDTETQLAWPDGKTYVNSVNNVDTLIYGVGTTNPTTYTDTINWDLTAGGTEKQEWMPTSGTNSGDLFYWAGSQWPEYDDGYETSFPNVVTNTDNIYGPPSALGYLATAHFGFANYTTSYPNTTSQESLQYNDQSQFTLVTGGAPGSTGSELYLITGTGSSIEYSYPGFPSEFGTTLSPQQIQVGTYGSLTFPPVYHPGYFPGDFTNFGTVSALLPMNTKVLVTPKGNPLDTEINIQDVPFQFVSQCVATTPSNRTRTTLGVGEQVALSFSPTLWTNATWKTSGGGLALTTGLTNLFTAPSNAPSGTKAAITVSVDGHTWSPITFNIVEPTGIDHSTIGGLTDYPVGESGVGMTNLTWIAPTSVSFYRVFILEVGEDATNVSGYFADTNLFTSNPAVYWHHLTADHWISLSNGQNEFGDVANMSGYPPPWTIGSFTWNIPARWSLDPNHVTNSMTGWNQIFTFDGSSGTETVQKFGHSATRTTNDDYDTHYHL